MSKEEAIEILSDMRCECNLFGDEEEATRYHALSWAINAMNTEPKHGQWVYVKTIINGEKEYKCSECNAPLYCYGTPKQAHYDYCYMCGAKMDEVEE